MTNVIVLVAIFFFLVPYLFMKVISLREDEKISKNMERLLIVGICLIPYPVAAIMMGSACKPFLVAYTILLYVALIAVGIIKLFQRH